VERAGGDGRVGDPEGGDAARGVRPVERDNLTARAYAELRAGLLEGRFLPGHRFKIRDLAASLRVSETPVREALLQLVSERALDMHAGRSITVARLTKAQYLELRTIRVQLEGLAAFEATARISEAGIAALESAHADLVAAEGAHAWRAALEANARFHFGLCRAAEMPLLLEVVEGIWLRTGALLNYLYPDAHPTYAGRHRHLDVIEGLRRRDPERVRAAIQADMIEGGEGLVRLLDRMEREAEDAPPAAAPRRRSA
jgi:DNA-binding GntR family transcriptional regulator